MPNTYNNSFSFNPKDIALIEEGLRALSEHHDTIMMISQATLVKCSRFIDDAETADQSAVIESKEGKIREVNELLGKIYNQKIFYSQTHEHEGVPLG